MPLSRQELETRIQILRAELGEDAFADAALEAGMAYFEGQVSFCSSGGFAVAGLYDELCATADRHAASARMGVYQRDGIAAYRALPKRVSRHEQFTAELAQQPRQGTALQTLAQRVVSLWAQRADLERHVASQAGADDGFHSDFIAARYEALAESMGLQAKTNELGAAREELVRYGARYLKSPVERSICARVLRGGVGMDAYWSAVSVCLSAAGVA